MSWNKYYKVLRNLGPSKKLLEVAFFVTNRCNFSCPHCFYWEDLKHKEKNQLSLEELTKFARTTPNLLRVLLTGGEPFLRQDLDEICRIFYEYSNVEHISIPTNASIPSTLKVTENILKKCPKAMLNISPSLDNLYDKRDKFVGCKGSFKKFLAIYHDLIELSKKHDNLAINIITTFNEGNQDDIEEILHFVMEELKAPSYAVNLVRGTMEDGRVQSGIDLDKYCKTVNIVEAYNERQRGLSFPGAKFFHHLRTSVRGLVIKTHSENCYQLPCLSGEARVVVSNYGKVFPCEIYMAEKPDMFLGNLKDFDFDLQELGKNDRVAAVLKDILDEKCFCHSECDAYYNVLGSFKRFVRIFINAYLSPGSKNTF